MNNNLSEKAQAVGPFLIDTVPVRFQLVESKEGRPKIKGRFGMVETATNNGRLYGEALMTRELGRLSEDIERRRVFGELDHPADGRTRLNRVSHIITSLEINEEKEVIGEAEILNTDAGRNLLAIIEAGGEVGVSSRGMGTTKSDAKGNKIVNEDFRLMTFDVVAEPATTGAYPKFYMEGLGEVALDEMTADDLRKHCHDAIAEIAHQAREEGRIMSLAESTKVDSDFREELKKTLEARLEDIRPAGLTEGEVHARIEQAQQQSAALQAKLEAVLAEKDAMASELDNAKGMAFKLANAYRMQQLLQGVDEIYRERVQEMIGDPKDYETLDALDEAFGDCLESVIEELKDSATRQKHEARIARKEAAVESRATEVEILRQELAQQQEERRRDAERMEHVLGSIQNELGNIRHERDNAISFAENAQKLSGQIMEEVTSRRKRLRPRRRVHETGRRAVREVLSEQNEFEDTDDDSLFGKVRRHVRKTGSVLSETDESVGSGPSRAGDMQLAPGLYMSEIMPLMGD